MPFGMSRLRKLSKLVTKNAHKMTTQVSSGGNSTTNVCMENTGEWYTLQSIVKWETSDA